MSASTSSGWPTATLEMKVTFLMRRMIQVFMLAHRRLYPYCKGTQGKPLCSYTGPEGQQYPKCGCFSGGRDAQSERRFEKVSSF
jgi:hypothetical protein